MTARKQIQGRWEWGSPATNDYISKMYANQMYLEPGFSFKKINSLYKENSSATTKGQIKSLPPLRNSDPPGPFPKAKQVL